MDKFIITETVNGNTNLISLNSEGQLVTASVNPLELPGFMSKEQAFKVIAGLRAAAKGTENKYRVKAASQALRDYCGHLILDVLPEKPMVEQEVIDKAVASWKPKVETKEAAEEPVQTEEPVAETKPAKKAAAKKTSKK